MEAAFWCASHECVSLPEAVVPDRQDAGMCLTCAVHTSDGWKHTTICRESVWLHRCGESFTGRRRGCESGRGEWC
jgi:hypothetical protein